VKWKGHPESCNSWVYEEDIPSREAIDEFFAREAKRLPRIGDILINALFNFCKSKNDEILDIDVIAGGCPCQGFR
jgi:site-specific DNA-cytosine methylase